MAESRDKTMVLVHTWLFLIAPPPIASPSVGPLQRRSCARFFMMARMTSFAQKEKHKAGEGSCRGGGGSITLLVAARVGGTK